MGKTVPQWQPAEKPDGACFSLQRLCTRLVRDEETQSKWAAGEAAGIPANSRLKNENLQS